MTRKAKLAIAGVGVLVVAFVVVYVELAPFGIRYRLWRYRKDPDAVNALFPTLCAEEGRDALPYIYEAFAAHGGDDDVAKFRLGVLAELACLRRKEGPVTNEDDWYADLEDEPKLIETIVDAFEHEPSSEIRDEMTLSLDELDFRAQYEIWAGMRAGARPMPQKYIFGHTPPVDGYRHEREHKPGDFATIRKEWCRLVRPHVLKHVTDEPEVVAVDSFLELGRAHCSDDDIRFMVGLAQRGESSEFALGAGLIAATDSVARAKLALAPLIANDNCLSVARWWTQLEQNLDAAVADYAAQVGERCMGPIYCVDKTPAECPAILAATLVRRDRGDN